MAGEVVTVYCKLPNGLQLQLHGMQDIHEPVMGGGSRATQKAYPIGARHLVYGFARRIEKAPDHQIIGGYGITPNVPKDFWDAWIAQNALHDAVVNKLLFAHVKHDHATGQAKEQAELKSGLEPIEPTNAPRGILIGAG